MLGHAAQSLGAALPGAAFGGFDLRNLQVVTNGAGTQGNLTISGHQAGDLVLVVRASTTAPALDAGFTELARLQDANQTSFKHQLVEYIYPTNANSIVVNQSNGVQAYIVLRGARPVQAVLKSHREGVPRRDFPGVPGFKRGSFLVGYFYQYSSAAIEDSWVLPQLTITVSGWSFIGNRCRLTEFLGAAVFAINQADTISGAIEVELA